MPKFFLQSAVLDLVQLEVLLSSQPSLCLVLPPDVLEPKLLPNPLPTRYADPFFNQTCLFPFQPNVLVLFQPDVLVRCVLVRRALTCRDMIVVLQPDALCMMHPKMFDLQPGVLLHAVSRL